MITDILGGKTGAADAASSAKQSVAGRKDVDMPSSGFSDALSKHDRDIASDDAVDDQSEQASVEEELTADTKPSKPKPIIDIRPEFLRSQGRAQASASEAAEVQVRSEQGKSMTPAERKLRDALMAAKAAALKSEERRDKSAAASGEDAQVADMSEHSQSVDASILAADDAKVADMLTLLTGSGAAPAAFGSAMPKASTGAQFRRDRDTDERIDSIGAIDNGESRRFRLAGRAEIDQVGMPNELDANVPGAGVFRFTNARNEGQSLDMSVEGGRERTTVEFRSPSNSGAENVTVLDSRRFLGLAPNSNSANLTALISGDSEWSAAMQPSSALSNAAAQSGTGTVVNMLKLQMNPHDLGSVTATLRLHGEELNVHLTVETRAAYRQLSEDSGGIVDALRAQGFAVDQVTISIAATADSDGAGNQSGQSGQQSAAEGGRQGFAAGRGQQQAENRQRAEQGARNTSDAVSENTQQTVSGSARPDQLYL